MMSYLDDQPLLADEEGEEEGELEVEEGVDELVDVRP